VSSTLDSLLPHDHLVIISKVSPIHIVILDGHEDELTPGARHIELLVLESTPKGVDSLVRVLLGKVFVRVRVFSIGIDQTAHGVHHHLVVSIFRLNEIFCPGPTKGFPDDSAHQLLQLVVYARVGSDLFFN